jgi:hypothetical protein
LRTPTGRRAGPGKGQKRKAEECKRKEKREERSSAVWGWKDLRGRKQPPWKNTREQSLRKPMAFQGEEERDLEGRGKKPGAGEPVPCIPVFGFSERKSE